jgi:hypothetical protein
VNRWHDLIGDPTIGDAILDRIVHNAHRIQLRGDPLRRKKAQEAPSWLDLVGIAVKRSAQPTGGATPADIDRNGRPTSVGTGGRHQVGITGRLQRNAHPEFV